MKRKGTWLSDRARMCPVMARCEGTLLRDDAEMCNACKQYRLPKKRQKRVARRASLGL